MVNCDECKERVLEVIEREAVDPDGVRQILEACPDCRAEVERVKAQLMVAGQLPLEAPSESVDVAILRAAEAHASGASAVAPAPASSSFFGQPWAMAAVALLVVGVGITTVSLVGAPRSPQLAQAPALEEQAFEAAPTEALELAAADPPDEAPRGESKLAPAGGSAVGSLRRADSAVPPNAARSRQVTRAKAKKEGRGASAPSRAPAADEHAGRLVTAESAEMPSAAAAERYSAGAMADAEDDTAAEPVAPAKRPTAAQPSCAAQIRAFEDRRKGDGNAAATPEEALSAGLCYQELGQTRKSRWWLQEARKHPSTRVRAAEALDSMK